ncbi:hypothetical protein BJ742DRAFT_821848 [Cladochytrium replicatum]|nr:hypothetical protein BJ742DRAFT_821848 [Cladochytrium replicatum]
MVEAMDRHAGGSSSTKHIHPYDPNDLPSGETVPIPDTDAMIEKALEQYESLNTTVRALDLIDHEISEYEAHLKELSEEITAKQRDAKKLETDLNKVNYKIKRLENGGIRKFVAKIMHGISQASGSSGGETIEEEKKRTRDELVQALADLKSEMEDLLLLQHEESEQLEAIKVEREEYQWVRAELDELLAQVFDGPSPNYTHEDDLEEEVKSCKAQCERLTDVIEKYGLMAEIIATVTVEIDKGVKLIREAKGLCVRKDRSFPKALETYDQVEPIGMGILALLTQAVDVVTSFQSFIDDFGFFPVARDLGFTPSKTDYYGFLQHLRDCTRHFLVLKYRLARTAVQIPTRISETKERLDREVKAMEAAKSKHFALRKQIVEHAWWERTAEAALDDTGSVLLHDLTFEVVREDTGSVLVHDNNSDHEEDEESHYETTDFSAAGPSRLIHAEASSSSAGVASHSLMLRPTDSPLSEEPGGLIRSISAIELYKQGIEAVRSGSFSSDRARPSLSGGGGGGVVILSEDSEAFHVTMRPPRESLASSHRPSIDGQRPALDIPHTSTSAIRRPSNSSPIALSSSPPKHPRARSQSAGLRPWLPASFPPLVNHQDAHVPPVPQLHRGVVPGGSLGAASATVVDLDNDTMSTRSVRSNLIMVPPPYDSIVALQRHPDGPGAVSSPSEL